MKPDTYHYTECGLQNVYLRNGFKFAETPRGEGVKIHDIDGLQKAIGSDIIRSNRRLSGPQFRFLRTEIGLAQAHLATLLDVEVQSVARWEKGQTKPIPGPADKVIRFLYDEHIGGNPKIRDWLQELADLDERIDGVERQIQFEETEAGWLTARKVA